MNNKMAIIHIHKQLNLKHKLSKQEEQRQNHVYGEHFDGCQMGGACRGMGEEVRGPRNTDKQSQNSHGDVSYSRINGVAKELISRTQGHAQRCWDCLREWRVLGGGGQKGKISTTVIAQSIKYN